MKNIDFYSQNGSDYLNCYGSDALIVARELGLTRQTVSQRHATAKHPAGMSHTAIPRHMQAAWFAELAQKGWIAREVTA